MIIDEIKKANMQALKERNQNARAIYSIVMTRFMNRSIELKEVGKEMNDEETIRIIQKTLKELSEEKEGYEKVNNSQMAQSIAEQAAYIAKYLPKMLSEEEIKAEIDKLNDKTIPAIMKYFKSNFAGKVDMALVNKVARQYN